MKVEWKARRRWSSLISQLGLWIGLAFILDDIGGSSRHGGGGSGGGRSNQVWAQVSWTPIYVDTSSKLSNF